jgi:multiple sugar transport system substrate-binding protein
MAPTAERGGTTTMVDMRTMRLYDDFQSGRIDRRTFVRRAMALGVSLGVAGQMLRAVPAGAQDASPAAGGAGGAPIVAQPGSGDPAWAGKSITVQAIDDSVLIPWNEVRAEFEAATGATATIVPDPIGEAFPRLLEDAVSQSNRFDAAMIGMWWLGELVAGQFIMPYDEFYDDTSGKFPQFTFEDELPGMQALRMYDGKKYVVPYDADGQVLYYRRDLLSDPAHMEAYKTETGNDLRVPQTWDELRAIAKYFNGKPLGGDEEAGSGISMHLKVGGQGMFHFMSLSAPYVIGPENPKLYWFDPDNMDPLVQSEGHRRAMESYLDLVQYGPPAMGAWALGEAWDYFLRGNAVFTYSWGDVAALAVERESFVKGKVGTVQLPGTMAYVNPKTGEEYQTQTPNIVGNTTGGSWAGVVMAASENPDLAYYWLALMATEPKQRFYAARGTDGVDPGRLSQIPPSVVPEGTGSVEDYEAQGWVAQDAEEYVKAYYDNYQNPNQLPFLRIPGTFEYWTQMDVRLSEALTSGITPEQALEQLAQDFREINDRLGVEAQLEIYKGSLGL